MRRVFPWPVNRRLAPLIGADVIRRQRLTDASGIRRLGESSEQLLQGGIVNDEWVGHQVVHLHELPQQRVEKTCQTQHHLAGDHQARLTAIGQSRKLKLRDNAGPADDPPSRARSERGRTH